MERLTQKQIECEHSPLLLAYYRHYSLRISAFDHLGFAKHYLQIFRRSVKVCVNCYGHS